MKYLSVEIKNYRSIGTENCKINLDTDIVTLIGKNESGKSNIVNALKKITFFDDDINSLDIYGFINKHTREPVKLIFDIQLKGKEILEKFPNYKVRPNYIVDTKIEIEKKNDLVEYSYDDSIYNILLSVSLEDEIKNTENAFAKLRPYLGQINSRLGNEPNRFDLISDEVNNLSKLSKTYCMITTPQINKLNKFNEKNNVKIAVDEFISSVGKLKTARDELYSNLRKMINPIFYYEDGDLIDSYTPDKLISAIKRNATVGKLMSLSQITDDDIKEWRELTGTDKFDKQRELIKKFENNFAMQFGCSYKQEDIGIIMRFTDEMIHFDILSDDKHIEFSERSDGFRWYFNLYVNLKYLKEENVLIIMDEPAVGVHINSKKEILEIFEDVVRQGNQVMYTTHSPFMIDTNNLYYVQLVEKENGVTTVSNKAHITKKKDTKIGELDTIAPIVKALGYDLKNKLGPEKSKKNVIVEGITDFYYLNSMWSYLYVDEEKKPNFLPCVGVSKENLVATILFGWGYDFVALLDLDRAGRKEYSQFKKLLGKDIGEYVYYNHVCSCKNPKGGCTCNKTIEDLLSSYTLSQLLGTDKIVKSTEFCSKIKKGENILDEETKNNFIDLFKRMKLVNE